MNSENKLLSVIIPVYNVEQYIEECVESILKQKYMPLEIILVDDGSSDHSGMLCDLLSKRNKCIKVLHVQNGGITKARLLGVGAAKGRWVTFVDADDWIDEGAYENIVGDKDADIVVTGICRFINEKRKIMQMPYFREGFYGKEDMLNEIFPSMLWTPKLETWALDPSLCTKIFKREIIIEYLRKASEVGSDYGEDSIVTFPMMLHVNSIYISQKIYYFHRQRTLREISPYIQDEHFFLKLSKVYAYLEKQFKLTEYWEVMKNQLDCFFISSVEMKKRCYEYPVLNFSIFFPMDRIPKESRVVLYGAGDLGKQYWEQNLKYHFCNIVLWVDKNYENIQLRNSKIENPEIMSEIEFDYVVIAVDNYYIARDIAMYLKKYRIKKENIIWHSIRVNRSGFEDVFQENGEKIV